MGNKYYIASISYGKDSIAMIHVIKDVLKMPLDRIITAQVWATDTIPADYPPMYEFKKFADKRIKQRWGIDVEPFCYTLKDGEKQTYEKIFYKKVSPERVEGRKKDLYGRLCHNPNGRIDIYGFPPVRGGWCNGYLKMGAIKKAHKSVGGEAVQYIGIAADEDERVQRHNGRKNIVLPLVEAKWTEDMCFEWCKENGLLAPTYENSFRDGCWFCHNQSLKQLRNLYHNYPDLWEMLLTWDNDSPCTFRQDGHTVHDYDRRFCWEDKGYLPRQKQFRWEDVKYPQMNIFQFLT